LSSTVSAARIVFKNIAVKFYSEEEIEKGIRSNYFEFSSSVKKIVFESILIEN